MLATCQRSALLFPGTIKPVKPKDFCSKWIPKIYGIQPGEYMYRKACIQEFDRHLQGIVPKESISKNWKWDAGDETDSYPDYLPPLLALADQLYGAMEVLKRLPSYKIARESRSQKPSQEQ